MRGEGRGEGLQASALVATPLILLAVEGFHFFFSGFRPGNALKFAEVKTCIWRMAI